MLPTYNCSPPMPPSCPYPQHFSFIYPTIIDYQQFQSLISQASKMCTSKSKLQQRGSINGRQVLDTKSSVNRTPLLERCNSIPMINAKASSSPTSSHKIQPIPPYSPRSILPLIDDQPSPNKSILLHKSKSFRYITPEAPAAGSIAAARREQVAILQGQRKMRIAHYGRTPKSKPHPNNIDQHSSPPTNAQRCTFITPNSDPIYVAYHDEEWGVPVHDDEMLFELLVLTGAQVGSDWSSVLRKREDFREAFCNFDAEIVSKFSEKKMISISAQYCIELSLVRGVVDNSKRILQVKKELGSFDKYVWGFVNDKAISTQYKLCNKIPVKTSKSEAISKDMVRRGFRQVGPTVVHSFMQAAGLTNDHLITCPRHSLLSLSAI